MADRLATVVADTSMITMSTAYTSNFHAINIDGKDNANMTGDRMKMLMLTLPFMVSTSSLLRFLLILVHTCLYYVE